MRLVLKEAEPAVHLIVIRGGLDDDLDESGGDISKRIANILSGFRFRNVSNKKSGVANRHLNFQGFNLDNLEGV